MPVLHLGREAPAQSSVPSSAPPKRGSSVMTSAAPAPPQAHLRLRPEVLERFTRDLQTQLSAGVPLLRALELQAEEGEDHHLVAVARHIADRIASGSSLAEALETLPRAFPPIYVNLVHAGEFAGQLERMLGELAAFLTWRAEIKKTLRQASLYPSLVVVAAAGLMVFVVGFVFPKFGKLFARLGDHLPPHVRTLIATGDFVAAHWLALALVAGAVLAAVLAVLRTGGGRRVLVAVMSRLPLLGRVYQDLDLAVLLRNLAILEGAGVPLVKSLHLASGAVLRPSLAAALHQVGDDLLAGDTFTHALQNTGELPAMVTSLVAVGEDSGRLADVFARLAEHHDRAAKDSVKRALTILEPLITLVLGVFVALVAVTVVTTLYQVIRTAGH